MIIGLRLRVRSDLSSMICAFQRCSSLLLLMLNLSACQSDWLPHADLAPSYEPPQYVVPASWHGSSPFVEAKPSDGELRQDWWKLFNDPVLNGLEEQAMAANPDLQAAAERFVQARDMMMKARSRRIPQVGVGFDASDNRQSVNRLFRAPGEPLEESSVWGGGLASWEPDFWSAIRNATRVELYRAEERAAEYGLARLSLQAEIAANYFTLRGYDAQVAIYAQSIALYKQSLDLVSLHVSVVVEGHRARTTVDHVFRNPHGRQLEGMFEYPLPAGASPSYYAMFLGATRTAEPPRFKPLAAGKPPLLPEALKPAELARQVDAADWGKLQEARLVPPEKAVETYEELPSDTEVFRILRNMGERGLLAGFPAVLVGRAKAWERDRRLTPDQKRAYADAQRAAVLRAVSAYAPEAVVRHGSMQSGSTFISKPFSPAVFVRKVRAVLDDDRHGGASP